MQQSSCPPAVPIRAGWRRRLKTRLAERIALTASLLTLSFTLVVGAE